MKLPGTILLAVATALFAGAAAAARTPAPRPSVPEGCSITIAFGSYGPGIDLPTLTRMERWLRLNRAVRNFTRLSRGREGELTLCVRTRSYRDASLLSRQLRGMIPPRPRGPINVVVFFYPHD